MNLTKMLKSEPLQSGFYAICGEQGAGKTSLATALFKEDYRRHRKARKEMAVDLARRFYEDSGIRLEISEIQIQRSGQIHILRPFQILAVLRGIPTSRIPCQNELAVFGNEQSYSQKG